MTAAASKVESGNEFFKRTNPNRRVIITELVLDAALLDEWEDEQRVLTDLRLADAASSRLANGGSARKSRKVVAQEKKIAGIEARLEEGKGRFTLRKMPSPTYQGLKDINPPRAENQLDMLHGYNRDAVADASIRACMVDPVFPDCEDPTCSHDPEKGAECASFQMLRVILGPTEWQELRDSVEEVNGAVKEAPKSQPESGPRRRLASGSGQPDPGE